MIQYILYIVFFVACCRCGYFCGFCLFRVVVVVVATVLMILIVSHQESSKPGGRQDCVRHGVRNATSAGRVLLHRITAGGCESCGKLRLHARGTRPRLDLFLDIVTCDILHLARPLAALRLFFQESRRVPHRLVHDVGAFCRRTSSHDGANVALERSSRILLAPGFAHEVGAVAVVRLWDKARRPSRIVFLRHVVWACGEVCGLEKICTCFAIGRRGRRGAILFVHTRIGAPFQWLAGFIRRAIFEALVAALNFSHIRVLMLAEAAGTFRIFLLGGSLARALGPAEGGRCDGLAFVTLEAIRRVGVGARGIAHDIGAPGVRLGLSLLGAVGFFGDFVFRNFTRGRPRNPTICVTHTDVRAEHFGAVGVVAVEAFRVNGERARERLLHAAVALRLDVPIVSLGMGFEGVGGGDGGAGEVSFSTQNLSL